MILELDAGNSLIKWRLLDDSAGVAARGSCTELSQLEAAIADRQPRRIRMASVRQPELGASLCAELERIWSLPVELARTTAREAGVVNAYQCPSDLGVDRWLAMLAAWNRCRQFCCVLSCGTALTVDVIDANGQHLGGYIVPGLHLQRKSLLQNTAIRLPQETRWLPEWSAQTLGRSTSEAVNHGILALLLGGLRQLDALRQASGHDSLLVTGGDAAVIASALAAEGLQCRCEPDIILDGLAYALP